MSSAYSHYYGYGHRREPEASLVYYHLHTTGFSWPIHITHISAFSPVDGECWERYVRPMRFIEESASQKSGITLRGRQLYQWNGWRRTIGLTRALDEFVDFLNDYPSPVILIGHNIGGYHNKVLKEGASKVHMRDELDEAVDGYIDTLTLFREEKPGLGKNQYNLQSLKECYLDDDYPNDAIGDLEALNSMVDGEFSKSVVNEYIRSWS